MLATEALQRHRLARLERELAARLDQLAQERGDEHVAADACDATRAAIATWRP